MTIRAGIVITGTEVLSGRVQDKNGPWIAERLFELGVELAHTTLCGDRGADIESQLRFMADQDVDVVFTSGGLGPTADDLTAEIVARFCGRDLVLDAALEERIAGIIRNVMPNSDTAAFESIRAANRKQALIPAGAEVLEPVGTAPGLVIPGKPVVVVLPGPPRELQTMWPQAIHAKAMRELMSGGTVYRQATLRMFGLPESALAETLRYAESAIPGFGELEITTCLRRGELEIVTRYEPESAQACQDLTSLLSDKHGRQLYSTDGSTVDEQVGQLLAGRLIATAESCTAGLLAARLTDRAGSSDYVAGGVVSYSNTAKADLLLVDPALIRRHGAVSEEVARAMADGALRRFGADTAVAITGIAGPGGGTREKPVGTVCFTAIRAEGPAITRTVRLPGNRADVRDRSTTVAMHLLRRLLMSPQTAS